MQRTISTFLAFFLVSPLFSAEKAKPNIVVILADDMGYGDVHALNPQSKIPTPNIDNLVKQGMTFLDSHSPSAVCTPTRYGLLTGRYCWRTRLKRGVLGGYSPPLLGEDRSTIASMLKRQGYRTGGVGKWHLGMQLPKLPKKKVNLKQWSGDPGIDFAAEIPNSPIHHGFDFYFGVCASLDMAPFVYVHNNRFTMLPTIQQPAVRFPHFVRKGPRAKDFILDEVLDKLTDEAIGFIERSSNKVQPFFLYLPFTAPHKPTQPHKRFRGKTGLGEYGDFVAQVDWSVGQVLNAIDKNKIRENTLVVFTSDNGSYMFRFGSNQKTDHITDARKQGYFAKNHRANGPFRGTKADIWEGGHHLPFVVRWPGKVKPSSKCRETICHTDLYATFAEITGAKIAHREAEDSFSLFGMMRGQDVSRGAPVIHHSGNGMFAIRDGKWKLVLGNGSGGREKPRGKPFGKPYRLFDMSTDIAETTNVAEKHPEIVSRMVEQFKKIRNSGRSTTE